MVVYSMKESYIIIVLLKSKIFYNSEENYSENDCRFVYNYNISQIVF